MISKWLLVLLLLICTFEFPRVLSNKYFDPYASLELTRSATVQDVKRAYKRLVKKWHPDKSHSSDAESRFIEISKAYELLSDPERKTLYDKYGLTDENPSNFHTNYNSFIKFGHLHKGSGSFEFWQSGQNHRDIFRETTITYEAFLKICETSSKLKPHLIIFYSDWCIVCNYIRPMWSKLIDELKPVEFGISSVHIGEQPEIAKHVRVKSAPYLAMVLDGQFYYYSMQTFSFASVVDFIRDSFPKDIVKVINDDNILKFLHGWKENKVCVLVTGNLDSVKIRYMVLAWEFRERASFGYINMLDENSSNVVEKYRLVSFTDSMLIFHENIDLPVERLELSNMPYSRMRDIVSAHRFLSFPRISSQEVFDSICPVQMRLHLCIVLFTYDDLEGEEERDGFRQFVFSEYHDKKAILSFSYIFREKQSQFINTLTLAAGYDSSSRNSVNVVILSRYDPGHLRFVFVPRIWSGKETYLNTSKHILKTTLSKALDSTYQMPFEAKVVELCDERTQGTFWKIMKKLSSVHTYIKNKVSQEDILPAGSIFVSLLFIVAGGYVMSYFAKIEEKNIRLEQERAQGTAKAPKSQALQLRIHELRGETYNGLIRLLKPGCRTIILLCDSSTKVKLLPKFQKACWPYRRNKTLMFAFMNLSRSAALEWYKRILILGLNRSLELNINPKNAVGTVISVNGHRKYYCLYHAKHEERKKVEPEESELESDSDDVESGPKRDETEKEEPLLSYYKNVLFEDQLLDGLSNWLERLFEGTCQRYYINYWPDYPGK